MEADLVGDDQLGWVVGGASIDCHCVIDESYCEFDFEATFNDIDFGQAVLDDPGNEVEVYAKVEDHHGQMEAMSTETNNIYGYVNGECKCIDGPCCDLYSGRPYDFKDANSQPTGYEDYDYCEGYSSPTSTNYVMLRDFYCDGSSAERSVRNTQIDSCGYCEGCFASNPVYCSYFPSSSTCGVSDCDYLDTICRNYYDVDRYCDGSGDCNSATCSSYTNSVAGTPCGAGNVCDGSGNCVEDCECSSGSCCDGCHYQPTSFVCDSNYEEYFTCGNFPGSSNPGNEVIRNYKERYCSGSSSYCNGEISDFMSIFYDYCSQDEYCILGESSCVSCGYHVSSDCYGGDVYWFDLCGNLEEKKEECGEMICSDGDCLDPVECYQDSDCGSSDFIEQYCVQDDLYGTYRTYTCNNPGEINSYCSYEDEERFDSGCGAGACFGGECFGNVYSHSINPDGWNTLVFLEVPIDNSVPGVFESIEGAYDNVWAQVDGKWLSYSPYVYPEMNTLLEIPFGTEVSFETNNSEDMMYFMFYLGNIREISSQCEQFCQEEDIDGFCNQEYTLEIEDTFEVNSCQGFVDAHPFLEFEECPGLCDQSPICDGVVNMKFLDNKFGRFILPAFLLAALVGFSEEANAQPPLPMELRGVVDTTIYPKVDSVFAFSRRTGKKLASGALPYSDTVSVPNKYRLQIPTDDPETAYVEGAVAGDTLDFKTRFLDFFILDAIPSRTIVHLPGLIDSVNLVMESPDDVSETDSLALPNSFEVYQNYPNPFNSSTTIPLFLARKEDVNIEIYNLLGKKVRTIYGGSLGAGDHKFYFDANGLASGAYFYRVQAGDKASTRKMLFLK